MKRMFAHTMFAVTAALAFALPAAAAGLTVILPTVDALPGTQVTVPIVVTPAPAGHGIVSIDYRLTFDPAVISASSAAADGFLQTWGPPYLVATPSYLAASAAGTTPIGATSTLLNTVTLTIRATAVPGTTMPLVFEHFHFNESPALLVTTIPGVLHIRAPGTSGVPGGAPQGLLLALASACPVADAARFAIGVPDGAPARLAIYSLDGRRVRALADALAPGPHELRWDLSDEHGARVPAGVYFAQLRQGERRLVRRLVVAG